MAISLAPRRDGLKTHPEIGPFLALDLFLEEFVKRRVWFGVVMAWVTFPRQGTMNVGNDILILMRYTHSWTTVGLVSVWVGGKARAMRMRMKGSGHDAPVGFQIADQLSRYFQRVSTENLAVYDIYPKDIRAQVEPKRAAKAHVWMSGP